MATAADIQYMMKNANSSNHSVSNGKKGQIQDMMKGASGGSGSKIYSGGSSIGKTKASTRKSVYNPSVAPF